MGMQLPHLMEVIRRCPYCKRESTDDPMSFAENPFCNDCLNERIAAALANSRPIVGWVTEGSYIRAVLCPERT